MRVAKHNYVGGLLAQANAAFRDRRYRKALNLYEQSAVRLGFQVVEANIRICKKRLAETDVELSAPLDPITKVLLHNAGAATLSKDELSDCLSLIELLAKKKSEKVKISEVNPVTPKFPEELTLQPLPDGPNDFEWYRRYRFNPDFASDKAELGISVIIPTFNRTKQLAITLACLVNQQSQYPFEVIVADDGSTEDLLTLIREYESKLDLKYVRQKDNGYQLCMVRNLGLRTSRYKFVAILDCDMAPSKQWVEAYVDSLSECDDIAYIGPRKYIDTSDLSDKAMLEEPDLISELPEIETQGDLGNMKSNGISIDWRLKHFEETEMLRLCSNPFRFFSGGNVAFARKWLDRAGGFDEAFNHWGGEDSEFGYRLFRAGCFFQVTYRAMAYHQEPAGGQNETDREVGKRVTTGLLHDKVPYYYRQLKPIVDARIHSVPLVSIYIPAYNCESTIEGCILSALQQTITDLEVCVCDDGSTDSTFDVISRKFGGNPRVRLVSTKNSGIAAASNVAVKMCRGFYIGQLDADDFLEPDAVEVCLREFFVNPHLACVYTTNRNVKADGSFHSKGYNWPTYSREKLMTSMICHHFRLFSARAWSLTSGFDESLENAVDYDMFLKLSEVGPFKHVNRICYNRRLHGGNTSIKKADMQKLNHCRAVNSALNRQGLSLWRCMPTSENHGAKANYLLARIN